MCIRIMLIITMMAALTMLSSDTIPERQRYGAGRNADSCDTYADNSGNPTPPDTTYGDNFLSDEPLVKKRNVALGIGLLAAEYTIGPAIAYNTWWQEGFVWDNPLNHIGEREPYYTDNAWHIAGCFMLTDLHYYIMHDCFNSRHAVLLAPSLTLFTFTIVECLDAIEKTGKWEFSLGDTWANVIGVGFWAFKHYYPDAPLDIRVGIRKWGDVVDLSQEALTAITDFDKFQAGKWDHYSILKVEGILRLYKGFYFGLAISKEDAPSEKDLWGITAGWDIVKGLQNLGFRNSILETISKYVSVPVSVTYWVD